MTLHVLARGGGTCHHQDTQTSSHHGYHTDITTPSLSHKHQHDITATQPSTHNHQHTDINARSLSHKRQHNFPVTQSCPARFYTMSTVFSLLRIVFVKPNMWGYHGLSGYPVLFLVFVHGLISTHHDYHTDVNTTSLMSRTRLYPASLL